MEIIPDNTTRNRKQISYNRTRNTYIGFTLIIASVVCLLHNFGILPPPVFHAIFSWPMLVILIGGYLLAMRQYVTGGIVTLVGLLLFLIPTSPWTRFSLLCYSSAPESPFLFPSGTKSKPFMR